MGKISAITIFSIIAIILSFGNIYGEDKNTAAYSDCVNNFDVKNIDYSRFKMQGVESLAVKNYSCCKAMVTNEIRECDKLAGSDIGACYEDFKRLQGFYVKLLSASQITPELVRNCVENKSGLNANSCKQFIGAFIKGDDSACRDLFPSDKKAQSNCQGIIKLDEKIAMDQSSRDLITFMSAVKNYEPQKCEKINDKLLSIGCKAYLTGDEKVCTQISGFKPFVDRYCRGSLKR